MFLGCSRCLTETTHAQPNFLRKQAFRHRRCHFVRGKLPYFLPCAAHMKIRESSTLKFITKNFSAKHHNNFSEALTFSSGRFQSISHAKRGVRCPKGIETRLNFRCKPAKCALIKAVWLQTQYQMRDYLFVINCRLRKNAKLSQNFRF